jgi:hypothetical protein
MIQVLDFAKFGLPHERLISISKLKVLSEQMIIIPIQ